VVDNKVFGGGKGLGSLQCYKRQQEARKGVLSLQGGLHLDFEKLRATINREDGFYNPHLAPKVTISVNRA